MSVIRSLAAKAIADALAAKCQDLAQPITVIDAPGSLPVKYPAAAVMLDKFSLRAEEDDPIDTNADGQPMIGAAASFDPGTPVALTTRSTLARVGMLRGEGRIWVAGRTAPQREAIEEQVMLAFFDDDAAPGRLLMQLADVRVGGHLLPFPWPVAANLRNSAWSDELAFSERLWTWLEFDLDVPLLIERHTPLARTLVLAVTEDIATTIADPTDLADVATENFTVSDDGSVAGYP